MTPSARSTQYPLKLGFIVAPVEKVIHMPTAPFPFKRDAFGFGDLLIARPGFGAALVQVTDSTHVSHRVKKICGSNARRTWRSTASLEISYRASI